MLVATTCRIQRWPTNLMKMKRNCFRRNAFQPLAPDLSATPSSNKRPPPVPPPVALNLGHSHNDFRRSRCSNGPGSLTRSAPRLAPLSEERFAKQGLQRVRLSFTTLKRCARKPIESRPLKTEAGENPAQSRHEAKSRSSRAASRCHQKPLLPEGSRSSRFHLSAVPGLDVFSLGFRGIRSKRIDAPPNPPC